MASSQASKSPSSSPPPRLRASTSPPSSPYLSPVPSSVTSRATLHQPHPPHLKSLIPHVPRRLLVPRSQPRCTGTGTVPVTPAGSEQGTSGTGSVLPVLKGTRARVSTATGKLTRARADSAPPRQGEGLSPLEPPLSRHPSRRGNVKDRAKWFDTDARFEVVEEELELTGYQIYAVEKWLVDRTRAVSLLTVHTGEMKDKITVTALGPDSSLSAKEAHSEWDKVIHDLRRDGARPRETDKGVIMVTSLANFRSDFTIVLIPDGDFLAHREQLYVNINLLRMGCSGRSALTLQEPIDTTKDRFLSMYHFPSSLRSPTSTFIATVLELVRLIQSALSIFDMFPSAPQERNGLLCDATVDGLQRWVREIGEGYMKIEPMERIADPPCVSALLSLVLCVRNKLNAIGFRDVVPKDPFVNPRLFTRALAAFVNQRLLHLNSSTQGGHAHSLSHSLSLSTSHFSSAPGFPATFATPMTSAQSQSPAAAPVTPVAHAFLNLALIGHIDAAFDKVRSSEAYKMQRKLLNKIDGITSATSSALASSTAGRGLGLNIPGTDVPVSLSREKEGKDGNDVGLEGTVDLGSLVARCTLLRGREGAPSMRYLWMGRLDALERKRTEAVMSDGEGEESWREKKSRIGEGEKSEEDDDEEGEGLGILPWSNRVQKKIESWAGREFGRVRSRKPGSIDSTGKERSPQTGSEQSTALARLPSVIISRDPEEPLSVPSSGQASPISPSASMIGLGAYSSAHTSARTSALAVNGSSMSPDDPEFTRRLAAFNKIRPSLGRRHVVASWSDPLSAAEETLDEDAGIATGETRLDTVRALDSVAELLPAIELKTGSQDEATTAGGRRSSFVEERVEGRRKRQLLALRLKRTYSFDDRRFVRFEDCLPTQRMQIDVDLCAQCLTMRRRRTHVEAVIASLQALLEATSASNNALRQYHDTHQQLVKELVEKCQIVADIEEAVSSADGMSLDTDALHYEAGSFDVPVLWRMAQGPRQRVFAIRERVFGTGTRQGVRRSKKSHGRFNRVQRTVDGKERLVDWLGRTESEVEEEADLPEILPGQTADADTLSLAESADEEARPPTPTPGAAGMQHKASSGWLLTLFTKWGSVLGVGVGMSNTASPAKSETEPAPASKEEKQAIHSIGETMADSLSNAAGAAASSDGGSPRSFHSAAGSTESTRSPLELQRDFHS